MPCNNCALIRVVFFFASCTLKKCAVLPKQLRRVSGAEDDWMVDRDELLGNNSEE